MTMLAHNLRDVQDYTEQELAEEYASAYSDIAWLIDWAKKARDRLLVVTQDGPLKLANGKEIKRARDGNEYPVEILQELPRLGTWSLIAEVGSEARFDLAKSLLEESPGLELRANQVHPQVKVDGVEANKLAQEETPAGKTVRRLRLPKWKLVVA